MQICTKWPHLASILQSKYPTPSIFLETQKHLFLPSDHKLITQRAPLTTMDLKGPLPSLAVVHTVVNHLLCIRIMNIKILCYGQYLNVKVWNLFCCFWDRYLGNWVISIDHFITLNMHKWLYWYWKLFVICFTYWYHQPQIKIKFIIKGSYTMPCKIS